MKTTSIRLWSELKPSFHKHFHALCSNRVATQILRSFPSERNELNTIAHLEQMAAKLQSYVDAF